MRIQYYIRPRNTTEESALVEELIQTIAERQRHGRRGRVGGRFPVASRSRAGGPGAVPGRRHSGVRAAGASALSAYE